MQIQFTGSGEFEECKYVVLIKAGEGQPKISSLLWRLPCILAHQKADTKMLVWELKIEKTKLNLVFRDDLSTIELV